MGGGGVKSFVLGGLRSFVLGLDYSIDGLWRLSSLPTNELISSSKIALREYLCILVILLLDVLEPNIHMRGWWINWDFIIDLKFFYFFLMNLSMEKFLIKLIVFGKPFYKVLSYDYKKSAYSLWWQYQKYFLLDPYIKNGWYWFSIYKNLVLKYGDTGWMYVL